MGAYEALAASYDRLTNDVDYGAIVAFYEEILKKEGLKPRTAVDLACGTGSVSAILAGKGLSVTHVQENYRSLSIRLTAEDVDLLDGAFPPPVRKVHLDSW